MANPVLDYLDRSIATFDNDPPANDYQRGHLEALKVARAELATVPVPMLLFCPRCGHQHVDEADEPKGWDNPPHRSHLCHECGTIWRPADVPTTGVAAIDTFGKLDGWSAARDTVPAQRFQAATATHYVLPRGRSSMVKEAAFFAAQGGTDEWGKAWLPVIVPDDRRDGRRDPHGLEMARRLAAHLPPIAGWQRKRAFPSLNPGEALDPHCSRYRQIADRGLL